MQPNFAFEHHRIADSSDFELFDSMAWHEMAGPVVLSPNFIFWKSWAVSTLAHAMILLLVLSGAAGLYQQSQTQNGLTAFAVVYADPESVQPVEQPTQPEIVPSASEQPKVVSKKSPAKVPLPQEKSAPAADDMMANNAASESTNDNSSPSQSAPASPPPVMAAPGDNGGGLFNGLRLISSPQFLHPPVEPVYPPPSIAKNEQGTVMVRVLVDATGTPQDIMIWQSSGYSQLDRSAKQAVMQWRFVPSIRAGIATAAWVEVPVNFVLN